MNIRRTALQGKILRGTVADIAVALNKLDMHAIRRLMPVRLDKAADRIDLLPGFVIAYD